MNCGAEPIGANGLRSDAGPGRGAVLFQKRAVALRPIVRGWMIAI